MAVKYFIITCETALAEKKYFSVDQVPAAEAMEKFTLDFNCRTILLDVVREIDRVDAKEMSRDTSGTRALSQFLVEVAERLPDQLQPCLTLLTKHLVQFFVLAKNYMVINKALFCCNNRSIVYLSQLLIILQLSANG